MTQKFVVAMMMHETNTFSPLPTPIESFARRGDLRGAAAIAGARGTNTPLGGFVDLVEEIGAEFVVPMAGNANPSGLVTNAAFDEMSGAIVEAVAAGCDGVMLALHGAMVTETYDDGEGELLRRIRAVAPDTPIAVGLDFHTQMTEAMARGATIITGYRTYPHIDMAETSRRAGRTLLRMLAGEVDPKIVWDSRPIMSSTLVHTPSREPMKSLMAMAELAEDMGTVLNASVFGGFPQADIPHLALSAVVVCDGKTHEGELLLARILDQAWEQREGFLFHAEPLADQIARAKTLGSGAPGAGPIILADHGDNTASGGTQDVMSVIEEAIAQGLTDVAAGPICDPGCVAQMIAAGVGAEVTLDLGGKVDMPAMGLKARPLRITGRVKAITDGTFTVTGPMATGAVIRMGRTAVLDTGAMQIVVSEQRSEPFDLGCFTHCGIDPTRKRYVLIKSRQHFRAGFEPIARHIVMCDGDGCTASDLALFDYRNVRRPLYPFDMDMVLGRNEETVR
jgi:microcystin degradation protein MlrC